MKDFDWETTDWFIKIDDEQHLDRCLEFFTDKTNLTVHMNYTWPEVGYLTNLTSSGTIEKEVIWSRSNPLSLNEVKMVVETVPIFPEKIVPYKERRAKELKEQIEKLQKELDLIEEFESVSLTEETEPKFRFHLEPQPNYRHLVVLTEYERGWGSEMITRHYFETYEEAMDYVKEVNSDNTSLTVSDYYIQASYNGEV